MRALAGGVVVLALAALGGADGGPEIDPASERASAWLSRVGACLKGVRDVMASFAQETIRPRGEPVEIAEGVVRARRGGLLRLDYQEPRRLVLVADGETLRLWDPGERTVVESPVGQSPLPRVFALVAGDPGALGLRWIGGAESPGSGLAVLEVVFPEPDPTVARAVVTLDGACPCLRRVTVADRAGVAIRLTLRDVKTNVGLGRGIFALSTPPGTMVIRP